MAVFNFRVSGAHTYLVREQDADGDVDALPVSGPQRELQEGAQ